LDLIVERESKRLAEQDEQKSDDISKDEIDQEDTFTEDEEKQLQFIMKHRIPISNSGNLNINLLIFL